MGKRNTKATARSSKRQISKDPRTRAELILQALGETPRLGAVIRALDQIERFSNNTRTKVEDGYGSYSYLRNRDVPHVLKRLKLQQFSSPAWLMCLSLNRVDEQSDSLEEIMLSALRKLGVESASVSLDGGGDSGSGEVSNLSWLSNHADGRAVIALTVEDVNNFPSHPYCYTEGVFSCATSLGDSLLNLAGEIPDIDWVNNSGGSGDVEIYPFDFSQPFESNVQENDPDPEPEDEDNEPLEDEDEGEELVEPADAPTSLEISMELPQYENDEVAPDPTAPLGVRLT